MKHDEAKLRVYLAHRAALIDYATPIVGSRAGAEDVVQEAYLRFVPHRPKGPEVRQPAALLYRIVRNLALDWTRRVATEARHQKPTSVSWSVPAAPQTPEQQALHRDDLRRVAQALAEMPDNARLACQMHRFGGHTLQEIADRLGISVPTAHRLVRSALLHIARRLDTPDG